MLTDEMKELLTAEELAAFDSDDDQTEGGEGDETGDEGGDNGNQSPRPDDNGQVPGESDADKEARLLAEQKAIDDLAAAEAANADATNAQPQTYKMDAVPLIREGNDGDAAAKLEALEVRRTELGEAFESGDKTTAQFMTELSAIEREASAISQEQFRTQISRETLEAQKEQQWGASVESFLNSNPEVSTSQVRLQAYDFVLRQVTGDEANAGKSDAELLKMAHDKWREDLGIQPPAPKVDEKDPIAVARAAEEAAKLKKTNKPAPVTTLADVPAASGTAVDDGKFAHLDRIMEQEPEKFEAAIARLSEADRNEYLSQ